MATGRSSSEEAGPTRTAAGALWALAVRLRDAGLSRTKAAYAALGLYLTFSLIVAAGAVLVFAEVAEDVLEGDTQRFDASVLAWIMAHRSAWLDRAALELTALGSPVVLFTTAVLVSVLLWHLERRRHVALIWVSASGAILLNQALKELFARPRPPTAVDVFSLSFPSGHAMHAMVFYTIMAYVLGRVVGRGPARTVVYVLGSAIVVLVGWTRMYLGVHYPTDIAAGYAAGYAWAISCCILIEALSGSESARARTGRGA
jgi:undecaprenyl-diphosphatase